MHNLRFPFLFLFCLAIASAQAQRSILATDSLCVTGAVKNPAVFTIQALDTFTKVPVPDQIIYNHSGEIKDTLRRLLGVPLKKVLAPVRYDYDKPRTLNEFYFVFVASDGYKVVCSWNEIYNTSVGDSFYIITGMENKKLKDMDQRIVFLSTADLKTGRRYIKGLKTIEVHRAN